MQTSSPAQKTVAVILCSILVGVACNSKPSEKKNAADTIQTDTTVVHHVTEDGKLGDSTAKDSTMERK